MSDLLTQEERDGLVGSFIEEESTVEIEYNEICQRLYDRCKDIKIFTSSVDRQIASKNRAKEVMTKRGCMDDARVRKLSEIYDKDIEKLYRESINALLEFEKALDRSIEASNSLACKGCSVNSKIEISVVDQLYAPIDTKRIKNLLAKYGYEVLREILLETWKLSSEPREQGVDPLLVILNRLRTMGSERVN